MVTKAPTKKAAAKKPALKQSALKPTAQAKKADWTILVYIAGDNNLDFYGADDLFEMKKVGSSAKLQIIAQRDTATPGAPTCRYRLQKGTLLHEDIVADLGETNTGDPEILYEFLEWGLDNYPAKRTMVVLWNHGSGWDDHDIYREALSRNLIPPLAAKPQTGKTTLPGDFPQRAENVLPIDFGIARNGTRGKRRGPFFISKRAMITKPGERRAIAFDEEAQDFLDNVEMKYAFNKALKKHEGKFTIIGMDACLMSMLEVGMQLKDAGELFCGSQDLEPPEGWPYDKILTQLEANTSMDGRDLCRIIVDTFVKSRPPIEAVTQSAYDFNDLPAVATAVDDLGAWLAAGYLYEDDAVIAAVVRVSGMTPLYQYDAEGYADIGDFCASLAIHLPSSADHCHEVLRALEKCVFVSKSPHKTVSRSRGLSIYFPRGRVSPLYATLDSGNSGWARFLRNKSL